MSHSSDDPLGWRLPQNPKAADFQVLIKDVFTHYRQRHNWADLPNEELLLHLLGLESPARELIIPFIDDPQRDQFEVYAQATRMARNPDARVLGELHRRGARELELRLLVRTRLGLNEIYSELRRRLDPRKVGRAIYRSILEYPKALEELREALHVERMRSYRPRKEDDEDLRSEATTQAFKKLEEMKATAVEGLKLPEQLHLPPIPTPTVAGQSQNRWDWPTLRAAELKETLRLFLPLLRGEAEQLPAKVHEFLKEHFRKWNAAKRAGEEVSLFGEEGKADRSDLEDVATSIEDVAVSRVFESRRGRQPNHLEIVPASRLRQHTVALLF
jgi:hypothetical protein